MAQRYARGLRELNSNCWAWLEPEGEWGYSNAGLIVDGDCSLLVDTLFDLDMTGTMLRAMNDVTPAAKKIDVLVNSHADGDHTHGNQLVSGARIIASAATAAEFFKLSPAYLREIIQNADELGEGAQYMRRVMGPHKFNFNDIDTVPPTETYDREFNIKVGDKDVRLFNVGPAHTTGDTVVYSVKDKVVYTGDLLFADSHPAIWAGSIDGWIAACELIMSLDVDVVVPGHGNVTDKAGVKVFRDYLAWVQREVRARFDAGLEVEEAAADIIFRPPYDGWMLPERIVGCVNYLYGLWGSPDVETSFLKMFDMLARYERNYRPEVGHQHGPGCGHDR